MIVDLYLNIAHFWYSSAASTIKPHASSSEEWCKDCTIPCKALPRSPPMLTAIVWFVYGNVLKVV